MNADFEKNLDKYAEVIVKKVLNIQPGQRLLIGMPFFWIPGTSIELAPLVRRVASHAYNAGARFVEVLWNDEQMQLIRLRSAPPDSFEEYPVWRTDAALEAAEASDAILVFISGAPAFLLGEDSKAANLLIHTTMKHSRAVIELRNRNAMNMALVFAPVEAWAEKVFPDIPAESRMEHAWNSIFGICRINVSDPLTCWNEHLSELAFRSDYLNKKQYASLRLSAPGTELSVGLPKNHIWKSASQRSLGGIDFIANMPTEEIFTLPHKDRAEGVVRMTRPIYHGSGIIDDIVITFSRGRVVKAEAGLGEELLHKLLETDEGVLHLGEVALVPHSSPISQTGLLYRNILIDENASNHLALGRGYRFSLEGGGKMSPQQFAAAGGNDSLEHLDFMIGSQKMDVAGVRDDGAAEVLMRSGEWAF